MSKTFVRCIVAAAAIVSAAPASRSQAQPLQGDIATELVVGEVSTTDDPFGGWIGVHVRLGPGWKIYWKAPGDAGVPPEFDWSASSNLALAEVQWPVPHRASILGIESVGYTGDVLFPVKVQLVDPDFDASAELKLVLYACNTICVREERVLKADLSRPSAGQGPRSDLSISSNRVDRSCALRAGAHSRRGNVCTSARASRSVRRQHAAGDLCEPAGDRDLGRSRGAHRVAAGRPS